MWGGSPGGEGPHAPALEYVGRVPTPPVVPFVRTEYHVMVV